MKIIDPDALDALAERARHAPRRRINLNLHERLSDPIQRLLNAGEPDTYVRPHRHAADRWELFAVLRGAADVLIFDEGGRVIERVALRPGQGLVEIAGGDWHAAAVLASGTVILEVKPGPYEAATDKVFAPWSPPEGDAAAPDFRAWLAAAEIGARWRG